jgi:dihydrofolate reductase
MHIRSRIGVSADGFVATPEGVPTLAVMPGFVPGASHGFPEFIRGCDAVVMGRNTFVPALGAPQWPWPGLQVYVLTSRPLPVGAQAVREPRYGHVLRRAGLGSWSFWC